MLGVEDLARDPRNLMILNLNSPKLIDIHHQSCNVLDTLIISLMCGSLGLQSSDLFMDGNVLIEAVLS